MAAAIWRGRQRGRRARVATEAGWCRRDERGGPLERRRCSGRRGWCTGRDRHARAGAGADRWQVDRAGPGDGGELWRSVAVASGEVVGVSADDTTAVVTAAGLGSGPAANVIVAYDLADGRQRWQLDVPVWDHLAGPALTSDGVTVYTGGSIRRDQSSTSGMVAESVSTVYDTLTGSELWNTHDNGRPHPGPQSVTATSTSSPTTAARARRPVGSRALAAFDDRPGRPRQRQRCRPDRSPERPADASRQRDARRRHRHRSVGTARSAARRRRVGEHDLRRQRRCGRTLRCGH